MDSNNLYKQRTKEKSTYVNQGGISVESTAQESLERQMSVSKMDTALKNELMPKEENFELIKDGAEILGGFKEDELVSNKSAGPDDSIYGPILDKANRQKRYADYPTLVKTGDIKAGLLLKNAKKEVKKGEFDEQMIATGRKFMSRLAKWIGEPEKEALDHLFIDGVPIKQFVSDRYGYKGVKDKAKDKDILSAYAAMIAAGQMHALTVVRQVVLDGASKTDIRNVNVNMYSERQGREDDINAIGAAIRGEEYRKYCENSFGNGKDNSEKDNSDSDK